MPRACVIALVLVLASCTPGAGSPPPAPASNGPTSAASNGPCIDRADLADTADTVMLELQGLVAALKVPNADQARTQAGAAASGLRSLGALVGRVQPDAEADFRDAADKLDSATSQFPGGQSLVDEAQAKFAAGLQLSRSAACPG